MEKLNILEDIIFTIKVFFQKNKNIIIICTGIVILINSIDVFTIKFGIDSEHFAILGASEMFKLSGRVGLYFFYKIFPMGSYQIISQILGIIVLVIASLLTISKYNFNSSEKILYSLIFMTYPSIAFMQYYYFQSFYIFFSILLSVVSYKLLEKNDKIVTIFGILLLTFSLSLFQGNISVFLTVMVINAFFNYHFLCVKFKKNIMSMIKYTVYLFIAVILYFIIQYILINFIWNSNDSYHTSMIAYFGKDFIEVLGNVLTTIWRIIIGHKSNWEYSAYGYVTVFLLIGLLWYAVTVKKIQNILILIAYILLFFLAIFSLEILLGTWIGSRVDIVISFYGAIIILLLYHVLDKKILKSIVLVFGILVILFHSSFIVKYQTAYFLTYKQDQNIAQKILIDLYNEYPEIYNQNYKMISYGKIESDKYNFLKGRENFGLSPFVFPFEEVRASYIINFLKLMGLPKHIEKAENKQEYKKVADTMPKYPYKGYIQLYNNEIVILNLN